MANIDVVRKGNSVWLWVIVILIVAVVLLALFVWSGSSPTANNPVSELVYPMVTAISAA
jgi:uncharacterized protein YggT (Ycf19 family)